MLVGGIPNVVAFTVIQNVRLVKVMKVEVFGNIGSNIRQDTVDVAFNIVFQGREESTV